MGPLRLTCVGHIGVALLERGHEAGRMRAMMGYNQRLCSANGVEQERVYIERIPDGINRERAGVRYVRETEIVYARHSLARCTSQQE